MITIRDLTSLPIFVYGDGNKKVPGALSPFVWTEVFLKTINQEPNQLILHIWPMTRTVILGMLDRQLPTLSLLKQRLAIMVMFLLLVILAVWLLSLMMGF